MTWHALLELPETTLWAWRKVRRAYQGADSLYDQAELSAFELNLEAELEDIRAHFAAGRWSNRPLRLIPQPKSPDKQGAPRIRQYFQVSVRDQVAWAAVATVLGPELDRKMPAWSYGNRLYRAAWYDDEPPTGKASRLNIGPYRHAAGHLYRRFKHSWPLYRRHIALTARRMVNEPIERELLDDGDRRALDQSEDLPYLDAGHWVRTTLVSDDLYAASFPPVSSTVFRLVYSSADSWPTPFESKDALKLRGYRWDATRRLWWREVELEDRDEETAWLDQQVYQGSGQPRLVMLTPRTRFRSTA